MEDAKIDSCFTLNGIVVEPERNTIQVGTESQRITSREMAVLMFLADRNHSVVPREELLDNVWKDTVVNEETLTLIISRLRKALGDDPKNPQLIETIPKKGYRLMVAPSQCFEKKKRTFKVSLGSPAIWITVLFALLLVFMSLFFTVKTEYDKVSRPDQTTQP
ncbi:MAG: transcriptional regulator [Rhodothermaceae bacterium]|nr:transcriptional regulator [Rhodothermaceae bacterium]